MSANVIDEKTMQNAGPPPVYQPVAASAPNMVPPQQQQPQLQQQQPQLQQQQPNVTVVTTGGGQVGCQHMSRSKHFTVCGIIWAVLCFPTGLLCLFSLMETKCNNCGMRF